jgi:carboxylesterase
MHSALGQDWSAPFRIDGSSGEAVVLIHGFTGHPGHWIPMSEMLADRNHTVVAPLLSGHGTARGSLAGSLWRDWVESARRAAESVADHRLVHLVGLSMGGLIAILLARKTASTGLVTINSPLVVREAKAYLAPLARHVIPSLPAARVAVPDPDLAHLWIDQEDRSTAAVDQLLRVIWHAWWEAGRLRRPALVIQSKADEAVRPVSGRLLAHRLAARLLWVDTRHNALLDPQRNLVNRAVVDHLAGLGSSSRGQTPLI